MYGVPGVYLHTVNVTRGRFVSWKSIRVRARVERAEVPLKHPRALMVWLCGGLDTRQRQSPGPVSFCGEPDRSRYAGI